MNLTTDADGNLVSQARYSPYGQVRWSGDTVMPTRYAFTGQRADGFGLMDYHARFYSPYLNRWISPDIIIPDATNPLDFDRFAYGRNNPLRYTDPSGHATCEDMPWECDDNGNWLDNGPVITFDPTLVLFTSCANCSWTIEEMVTITGAVKLEAEKYAEIINTITQQQNKNMYKYGEESIPMISSTDAFLLVRGGHVNFERSGSTCAQYFSNDTYKCWGTSISATHIIVFSNAPAAGVASIPQFASHELGHGFDQAINYLGRTGIPFKSEREIKEARNLYLDGGIWQQSIENNSWELYADTHIAWIYNHYAQDITQENPLQIFMTTNEVSWFTTILAHGGR